MEENVLVTVEMNTAEVHMVVTTVLERVVRRVEDMIVLVNLETMEDANTRVMGAGLEW